MNMSVVFCLKCGSGRVDIVRWENKAAVYRCASCGREEQVHGFTLGKADFPYRWAKEAAQGIALAEGCR